jgi:formyl-CoA transferase
MSHVAGYDFMIQGMGGLMSLTGERDGEPGGGPMRTGIAIADLGTGMYATVAILAALAYRTRTGEGQHIDMALLDVQVALTAAFSMNYFVSGHVPQRVGNTHPNIVPYQVFAAADGDLVLAIGNDRQFATFCGVAGLPYAADPRFARNAERVRNRETLIPQLSALFQNRRVREWVDLLEPLGVPIGPINNLAQVFADPQVKARGMQVEVNHPLRERLSLLASPMKLSTTPTTPPVAPPLLGQHTTQVLQQILGLEEPELHTLRSAGAIA